MTEPREQDSLPEPVENVDYFIDLYALVQVDPEVEMSVIRDAIRERSKEYTTDRQEGTASEFGQRAERMMRLINRARGILLDEDKRREYDALLEAWEGPISEDGTPVTTFDQMFARRVAGKDAEQVEALFLGLRTRIFEHPGMGSEEEVARVERRLQRARGREDADEEEIHDLQVDYEHALFALDVAYAIEENERSQVLGRNISDKSGRHYRVSIDYAEDVAAELTEVREQKVHELTALASGSFATRLAILSGEEVPSTDVVPARDIADFALPVYFDDQVLRVKELAEKRQEIINKRLLNLFVEYPAAELQTELQRSMFIGVIDKGSTDWYTAGYDPDTDEMAPPVAIPEGIFDELMAENYAEVIAAGFNIVTTRRLENIEDDALVRGAATINIRRFRPEVELDD
jgi:curved DNA-binding protein CbpA